jgi:hypothetical protein
MRVSRNHSTSSDPLFLACRRGTNAGRAKYSTCATDCLNWHCTAEQRCSENLPRAAIANLQEDAYTGKQPARAKTKHLYPVARSPVLEWREGIQLWDRIPGDCLSVPEETGGPYHAARAWGALNRRPSLQAGGGRGGIPKPHFPADRAAGTGRAGGVGGASSKSKTMSAHSSRAMERARMSLHSICRRARSSSRMRRSVTMRQAKPCSCVCRKARHFQASAETTLAQSQFLIRQ